MFLFFCKKIDVNEFLHPHQKLYSLCSYAMTFVERILANTRLDLGNQVAMTIPEYNDTSVRLAINWGEDENPMCLS